MLQIASKALVLLTATNFVAHVRVSAFSNPGSSLLGRQPTTGRLPRREADAFRVARNVNPLVLRVASNDGSSSENRAGASAKGAGPVDATVVSTTSSRTSSSLGGSSGKDPNSTGWLAKLRALPAVTKSTLVALFAALAQLASARKWRSALTPGRGNGNGGNNPFARLLNKLPAKQQLLVRRLAVPVASIALFTALNLGGSHAPKPPPPREVSYSEFFRVVEKSPKAFHGGVLMGSGRWDFAVTLPVEHPLPGMPLASVTPEAAAAATTLNKATPTGTAAAAANAAAAAGSKAPLPTRVSSEASPKGSGTSSLPSSATTDAAAATVRGSGYKAVRLYTRPVGPTNQPLPSDVLALLLKQEVNFMARPPAALGAFSKILFPVAYLALVFYFYNKTMGGNSAGNVGSRVEPGALPAGSGFEGVAGLGPAKFEVAEIVNMLRDPARFVMSSAKREDEGSTDIIGNATIFPDSWLYRRLTEELFLFFCLSFDQLFFHIRLTFAFTLWALLCLPCHTIGTCKWGRACLRASCWWGRRAPAKRCSRARWRPKRGSRSTLAAEATSWRCSWGGARRACVSSLRRPRRLRAPPSSSWMNWTQWGAPGSVGNLHVRYTLVSNTRAIRRISTRLFPLSF